MRPRYLEIEGLQSFVEKQKVDFNELGETGLFGIFGPTGSGKSTVLDAITLALYGEVNRALSGTQGIINTSSSAVKVSFDFDLKKDGKYKSYRVERLYQRKKGTENSCEAKVARLLELNETGITPIADKPREVTSRVEELIGLRHDDFMRAVVLPQNKFQEFLMLDKYKKREMLERIFYMEEYGKQLTEKVSARLAAVREKMLMMQGELLALGDSSDKALVTAEEGLKAAQLRSKKALEDFKRAEIANNVAKELWQLVSDLNVLEQREREHSSAAPAITEKSGLLDRAIRAKSLEDIIGRFENISGSYNEIVVKLQPVYELLPEREKELAAAKTAREAGISKAGEERKELIERRMNLNQALEVKKELDTLNHDIEELRSIYKSLRSEIEALDKKIGDKNKTIEVQDSELKDKKRKISESSTSAEYREQVQAAAKLEESLALEERNLAAEKARFIELSGVVGELDKKIAAAEAELEKAQVEASEIAAQQAALELKKPADRGVADDNIQKYHVFDSSAAMLALKNSELTVSESKSKKLEAEIQKQKDDFTRYDDIKNKLYENKAQLDEKLGELRKILQINAAYMLSIELREGEPCPVCGSVHHPLPASGNSSRELAETEAGIKEMETALQGLAVKIKEAENNYTTAAEQIRQSEKLLEQLISDCQTRRNELSELSGSLFNEISEHFGKQEAYAEAVAVLAGKKTGAEDFKLALKTIEGINSSAIEAITDWHSKNELLKTRLISSNSLIAGLKADLGSLKAEQKVNTENLIRSQVLVQKLDAELIEKSKSFKLMVDKLGIASAVKEAASLLEKDATVEGLMKENERQQEKIAEEKAAVDKLKEERSKVSEKLAAAVNDGKHMKEQKDLKESRLKELSGDSDAAAGIKAVEDRMLELGLIEKQLSEKVEQLDSNVKNLTEQKNTMEGRKNTMAASMEEITNTLTVMLREKNFSGLNEAKRYIIAQENINELDAEIKTYRQEESNIKAQKDLLLKKLDGKSITQAEWGQKQQEYEYKLSEKDETAASYEVARNVYNTIKLKNGRWTELNTGVKSAEHTNALLEQIKGLLKGNSFIEYVAEERLRYIAREASETLGVMTRFRYALELDSDNGFVIRDNASGGVHRPVTSLSGGEIFLTSLSLALALSSQIHLKGQSPLEFFFLDEGFGTLDNNLLDQVLDSLERISTSERVIGLISHVPELKNRITRRLVVEPPCQEGSGSHVHIEKA